MSRDALKAELDGLAEHWMFHHDEMHYRDDNGFSREIFPDKYVYKRCSEQLTNLLNQLFSNQEDCSHE